MGRCAPDYAAGVALKGRNSFQEEAASTSDECRLKDLIPNTRLLPLFPASPRLSTLDTRLSLPHSLCDCHGSIDPDFAVDDLSHFVREADAAVGGWISGENPGMETDPLRGETHEILHRGTTEARPTRGGVMPAADSRTDN